MQRLLPRPQPRRQTQRLGRGQTPDGAFRGSDPAHGTRAEGALIARFARFGRVRVRTMRVRCDFYCLTKVRQIASRGGCDWPRLLWTEVITCHLRRPPVASALAAGHGIRRGLHAAPSAPADAFGRRCASCCSFDLRRALGRAPARRLAQGRSVRSVPSRRTRMRAAPTQRSPIASAEAPHLLPPPMADDPIHNRGTKRRPARRRSSQAAIRRVAVD